MQRQLDMLDNVLTFRGPIDKSDSIAFGCSRTWGVGVEPDETWSCLLGAKNCGIGSASSDLVVRIADQIISQHRPKIVYCLWPDWSRFEYIKDGKYYQSLPSDKNRIYFMKTHDDAWCKKNFAKNLKDMANLCLSYSVRLIDMTLYDLIPYIDHSDRWPLSKLGHHYSPVCHQWVADIFAKSRDQNFKFPLTYE